MIRSPIKTSLAALASCAALAALAPAAPASAADDIPFETVKGWRVERSATNPGAAGCLMSRAYKDPDDGNAASVVVFTLEGGKANLVLVYEKWTWDKKETVKAPLSLDKRVYAPKATWVGDGMTLVSQFPDTIVPHLLAAKAIVLKFDDGPADFEIPNFAEGYESLRRCDLAKPSAAVPAPPATAAADPAGGYVVTVVSVGKDFAGCSALNESAGLSLIGVGQSLGLIAYDARFPFGKGAAVKGTWGVDQGAGTPFALTADTAKTVSLDVPDSRDAVVALMSGKVLAVEANGVTVPFSLAGMNGALDRLATCMETKKAP